jgi:ABC-type microcin C transport system permease subunit YejE
MLKKISTQTTILTTGVIASVTTIYQTERTIAASNKTIGDKISQLEGKIDSLSNQISTMTQTSIITPSLPSNSIDNNQTSLPNNLDVNQASLLPESFIDSLLTTQITFSTCIILFVISTFLGLYTLLINFLINKYGEKWQGSMPSYLVPITNWYLTHIVTTTTKISFMFIIISQSFILFLTLYMKFRGIA